MKELKSKWECCKLGIITSAGLIAFLLLGADVTSAFILTVCAFAAALLYMFSESKLKKSLKYWMLIPLGIGLCGAYQGGVLAVMVFLVTILVILGSVNPLQLDAECTEED